MVVVAVLACIQQTSVHYNRYLKEKITSDKTKMS